jgi:hypothetical protein
LYKCATDMPANRIYFKFQGKTNIKPARFALFE